jgi:predicted NUDIX family phosphoesterase
MHRTPQFRQTGAHGQHFRGTTSHVTELVLVLPRAAVPGGCDFTGLRPLTSSAASEIRIAVANAGRWMERDVAEQDPSHKQLIPYVIVRDGPRAFLMERTAAGGDKRLHHRTTIGVGGHINPIDDGTDPIASGLRREWNEELEADWEPQFEPIGLLNDDRNPVGSVHLGLVYEVDAIGRPFSVREHDKLSGRLAGTEEIHAAWDRMESWSQLVAAALWGSPTG